MTDPAPAARARASANVAIAVSWAPVPVRSHIVISASEARPILMPLTISPSSGGVPRFQSPAASALRNSPSFSHWLTRSAT